MEYRIDEHKILDEIKKSCAKRVMLQIPDGLKPKAKEIVDLIRKETDVEVLVWAGSCYGACDIPKGIGNMNVDILFHLGHNEYEV